MIIYTVLKDSNETNYKKIVDDEIIMLGKYLSSQRGIKKSIASYKKKISKLDNSAQKQTLLSLLDTASLQIEMVTEDLNTLNTILIESPELTKKDVDEYNRLLKNVEKNITLVNDMFQRVVNSWESITGFSAEFEEDNSNDTVSGTKNTVNKLNTTTKDVKNATVETTTPKEKTKTKSTKEKVSTITSSNKRLEVMQKEMAKVARAEKLAKEKEQKEIAKAKKLAKEEKERLEKEKLEKERLEQERLQKERLEQERLEREKIAEEAKKNIEAKLKEALVPVIDDEAEPETLTQKVTEPEVTVVEPIKEVAKNVTPTTPSTNVTRLNPETIDTTETLKKQIMASKFIAMSQNSYPENIKPVSTDTPSSDLICNFPKNEDDILSITTVQNEYSISFNKSDVTVSIEKEKFNITLKTIGVQFSNGNKVLSISRAPLGYFLSTNLIMDLPDYLNVAKVDIKNKFVNLNLLNPELNISVNNSQLTFSQNPTTTTETQGTVVPTTPTATIPQVSTPIALIKTSKQPEQEIVTTPAPTIVQEDVVLPESADTFVNDNEEPFDPKGNLLRDNNTLIISEDDDHIVLPYKLSDAEKAFKTSKKKYYSVEDFIENEYILPMSAFKNPITSRFREAFQLMKKKENGNFKEAIDLGFELMFQFDLNPAIIAACKNLEELDIYLDCLDDNEVDKFDCFNIEYRTPPSTKKKKK